MRFAALAAVVLIGSCASGVAYRVPAADLIAAPALRDGVFFLQAEAAPVRRHPLAWGLPAHVLRDSATTGAALDVSARHGWRASDAEVFTSAFEIAMLSGDLSLNGVTLHAGDYARAPARHLIERPQSAGGAHFLLFFETGGARRLGPRDVDGAAAGPLTVVRGDEAPWMAGTAMAAAGRTDVPLRIKHFRNDPVTGARTYLVAVSPGVTIPWEKHDVAEEAYVIEGDYRLAECFPSGPVVRAYAPGGYFYRPPGFSHNGPQSGTQHGTVMLIRTPGPLKVQLTQGC